MLTRPGSEPGPEWMRRLLDGSDPRRLRRMIVRIVIILGVIQMTAVIAGDIGVYRARGKHVGSYNSPLQIAGMPLVSVGGRAHGAIAYGGLSLGIFGCGGLTLAGLAVAPVAIGWRAIGAVAIGDAAAGALAIGRCAYAGPGVALGRDEASGVQKESLFG